MRSWVTACNRRVLRFAHRVHSGVLFFCSSSTRTGSPLASGLSIYAVAGTTMNCPASLTITILKNGARLVRLFCCICCFWMRFSRHFPVLPNCARSTARVCCLRSSGYFTIPMGFCDLILKEGGRERPIKTWLDMLLKQIPAATEFFPPAVGRHADDTWEHVSVRAWAGACGA